MQRANAINHRKLNNLIRLIDRAGKLGEKYFAYVTTKKSTGRVRKKGKFVREVRTPGENYLLLIKQQETGRNPVFLTDTERVAIVKYIAQQEMLIFTDPKRLDEESVMQNVAKKMVARIKNHIKLGKSADGRMAKLNPRYAMIKKKVYGSKPIMVRTGAFRRSLTAKAGTK